MAMNKKELAEFEALKRQAAVNRALRWTKPVARDLPPPEKFSETTHGFDFNTYNASVFPAWSSSVTHGTGIYDKKTRSASQNCCSLFSTEVLALRALRHALENEAAKKLADIDARIAELTEFHAA